jgi:hypothetical protein
MKQSAMQDYEVYREIMDDLHAPLKTEGLDIDMIKELYVSKLIYLENLRVKCFTEINKNLGGYFSHDDYRFILEAIHKTKHYMRAIIFESLARTLK